MTARLERAARDYAIAVLSAPDVELCVLDVMHTLTRIEGLPEWEAIHDAWDAMELEDEPTPKSTLRILRARVALYLRLMRRVEACDRGGNGDGWATFRAEIHHTGAMAACSFGGGWNRWDAIGDMLHPVPWRPLWLDAPPHEPEVTPAQRREGL